LVFSGSSGWAETKFAKGGRSGFLYIFFVVSPDVGNMKIADRYAAHLGGKLAIVHKKRVTGKKVQARGIIGDVNRRNIIMCDDMITTADTMCQAARILKDRGAMKILVGATHGIFADEAVKKLRKAPIEEVVVTDTITLKNKIRKGMGNIKVLTVAEMLAEAIKRIHNDESVSSLFK